MFILETLPNVVWSLLPLLPEMQAAKGPGYLAIPGKNEKGLSQGEFFFFFLISFVSTSGKFPYDHTLSPYFEISVLTELLAAFYFSTRMVTCYDLILNLMTCIYARYTHLRRSLPKIFLRKHCNKEMAIWIQHHEELNRWVKNNSQKLEQGFHYICLYVKQILLKLNKVRSNINAAHNL